MVNQGIQNFIRCFFKKSNHICLYYFSLLFTARSSALRTHAGEISFPGGKFDTKLDKNAEDTALRETEEELGIPRGSFEIWAQLPSLQGRDGKSAVTPVIALLKV